MNDSSSCRVRTEEVITYRRLHREVNLFCSLNYGFDQMQTDERLPSVLTTPSKTT
ncbi:MAG: hypothetical protein JO232_19285 [Verrucomicrobia bacterium]|nr:hypothetical protein [Verrucomicrobiota bacterium]